MVGAAVDRAAVDRLVEEHLGDPGSGWSMGTRGAIAEFVRDPGEPATSAPGSVVTARGGIRLVLPGGVRPVAYETPAGPRDDWNHAVALCLPADDARCAVRTSVTELGPDEDGLRPADRASVLFDLGLGTPTVDVCVRVADPELLELLRASAGRSLFADGGQLAGRVAAASPHRVFATACGRVEVFAAIPPAAGRSPDGPHTHLLPHLLRTGAGRPGGHPATVPIPVGLVSCAELYPPHPARDLLGRPTPFDAARHHAFQGLLQRFGDAGQRRVKAATISAVRSGGPPPATGDTVAGARDPLGRAAVAVALRQLAHTDAGALHPAWADRRHPPAALLDPDGDRNGG